MHNFIFSAGNPGVYRILYNTKQMWCLHNQLHLPFLYHYLLLPLLHHHLLLPLYVLQVSAHQGKDQDLFSSTAEMAKLATWEREYTDNLRELKDLIETRIEKLKSLKHNDEKQLFRLSNTR